MFLLCLSQERNGHKFETSLQGLALKEGTAKQTPCSAVKKRLAENLS
jgi:hypothetical protein